MFDIAFTELLVIGIVALIVIGPERLPKVARTAGSWLGKLNRYVAQVKQDIDRDMQLEELRKLQAEMKASAQKYELMAEQASQKVQQEAGQVDKVMQAMAVTDGGLALQEYEKLKAGQGGELPRPELIPRQADEPVPEAAETPAPVASVEPDEFKSGLDDEVLADDLTATADTGAAKTGAAMPGEGKAGADQAA